MLEINPTDNALPLAKAQRPRRPKSKGNPLKEAGKFLIVFAGFFILTAGVVMWPTLYERFSYYFGGGQVADRYKLPSVSSGNIQLADNRPIPKDDRLVIPKLNVDAPIVYPTSASNDVILASIQNGVALYPGTALPGKIGNTFITGHSSYYWWSGGQYNQIFANLDKLTKDDLIVVYYKGNEFIYKVTGTKVVSPKEVSILDATPSPTLSLMTCTPVGTNLKRLVVLADLVSSPDSLIDYNSVEKLPELPRFLPLN